MSPLKVLFSLVLVLLAVMVSGCNLIPSSFEISTTSELGPNTLNRIDDINDTLATGVEIGPETRAMIEEINQAIDDGLEFGFTSSTLQRVDVLLGMIEQGVGIKAGLDYETNQTVNNLIDTLDKQPGQWENTMSEIIHTLEGSTSRVAEQMADEVQGLMVEARINTQQLSASMGAEFRCNVDFMSTRAGDTLDQFIGRSLVGRLQEIVTGEKMEEEVEEIPIPMVCQMVPDQVTLEKIGEEFVFDTAVVRISGYNFVEENKPTAFVVDEAGHPVEAVNLYPFLSSPYQIQLNLQDIDFSAVPSRSRIVFEWPNAGTFFALAMVLPSEEPTPTVEVRPELTLTAADVEVRIGPGEKYFSIGKAAMGATYLVSGHNGDQSWWQIDFDGETGWVPAHVVSRNAEPVGAASSLPLDPPTAAFSMDHTNGKAPLEVRVWDESTGEVGLRAWEVIPEGGAKVSKGHDQQITHTFNAGGIYTVRLYVENQFGKDELAKTIHVEEPDVPIIIVPLKPLKPVLFPTATPQYSKNFIFRNWVNVPAGQYLDTRIRTDQYNCGVISIAALHGDIQEHKTGHVMSVWLSRGGTYWGVEANFRTHDHDDGGQEHWSLGLMCVDKSMSKFISDISVRPSGTNNYLYLDAGTYNIPPEYTCSIAGYDVKNVNVEDDSAGDIIQVFTRKDEDGEWIVTADFMEEGGDESWLVQMLCFYDNQEKVLDYDDPLIQSIDIFDVEHGGYQTQISSSQYACGVAGMRAIDGEVNEDHTGDIIRVYPYEHSGKWWLFADFRSEDQHEKWDIDLMCIDRSVVDIDMNQWRGEWIKR